VHLVCLESYSLLYSYVEPAPCDMLCMCVCVCVCMFVSVSTEESFNNCLEGPNSTLCLLL